MLQEILDFNRQFVANQDYQPYITSKLPNKHLAIVSCMDTRLTTMLLAALGLRNGDAKVIKNAGGLVDQPFDSAMRSLLVGIYELGVEDIMIVGHSDCGACHLSGKEMHQLMLNRGITPKAIDDCQLNVEQWLEGFHDTPAAVRRSVNLVRNHPLVPKDVRVYGFIIDSTTGLLTEVDTNNPGPCSDHCKH